MTHQTPANFTYTIYIHMYMYNIYICTKQANIYIVPIYIVQLFGTIYIGLFCTYPCWGYIERLNVQYEQEMGIIDQARIRISLKLTSLVQAKVAVFTLAISHKLLSTELNSFQLLGSDNILERVSLRMLFPLHSVLYLPACTLDLGQKQVHVIL